MTRSRRTPRSSAPRRHADASCRCRRRARLSGKRIVLTTVNARVQRVPPRTLFRGGCSALRSARRIDLDRLTAFLDSNGYIRTETVREAGRVRGARRHRRSVSSGSRTRCGSISSATRSRGAELRSLEPAFRRGKRDGLELTPMNEVLLDDRRSSASAPAIASNSAPSPTTIRSTNRSARGDAISAWSIGCRSIMRSSRRCSTICPGATCRSITGARCPRRAFATIVDFYAARKK